jgi:hypothetical protein
LLFADIGQFEFYLVLLALIYWCLDKRLGMSLAFTLGFSYLLNGVLKHAFRDPRPYWTTPELQLSSEDSYGVPSGHSQTATIFYGILAFYFRQGWLWIVAGAVIVIMLLSRIYLGVHDLEDVIVGTLIAILILAGVYIWRRYLSTKYQNRILGQRLFFALLVPLALGAVYILLRYLSGEPNLKPSFQAFVDEAEIISLQNVATAFGILLGLVIGLVLEGSRVCFRVDGPLWKRAFRYLVGIVVVLAIWMGLGLVFPDDPVWLGIPLRIFRYCLLALWVAYYAPWIFVRLGLADAGPRPVISVVA